MQDAHLAAQTTDLPEGTKRATHAVASVFIREGMPVDKAISKATGIVDLVLVNADAHWYPDEFGVVRRHDTPHRRNANVRDSEPG